MSYFIYPVEDGGGGGGSGLQPLAPITLVSGDITAGSVDLGETPTDPSLCRLTVGGVRQLYAVDFTISGSTLSWSGLGLDGILISGDVLQVEII